ncbi:MULTISPECIES: CGNR zinc finger domain-containing protein [unclassified Agromyces]|uniref:CGNR zinc finger domain-containing protein n=1 Tax=unclassified Agromyces TaxID=2639701 RepID=UPI0030142947
MTIERTGGEQVTTDAARALAERSLLLDLVNSRLRHPDRVDDELGDDAAASAWLVAHGGTGDADEIADARAVRPVLVDVLRGERSADELAPWVGAITRRPALGADGIAWRDDIDPARRVGARAMLEWSSLQGPEGSRIRPCAASDCQHFFIDTSRGNTRQWHSMETCGNRAKARRHYARTKRA